MTIVLIDDTQVGAEIVGFRASAQHTAGQDHTVIDASTDRIDPIQLRGLDRNIGSPRLAVQQGMLRAAELRPEYPAQIIGVGCRVTDPKARVAGARTGPTQALGN